MKPLHPQNLVKLARAIPPDDQVPYGFHLRVMARLTPSRSIDPWAFVARLLWKAAIPCLAVTLFTGAFATFLEEQNGPELLAADLENTVLAPIELDEEAW